MAAHPGNLFVNCYCGLPSLWTGWTAHLPSGNGVCARAPRSLIIFMLPCLFLRPRRVEHIFL